MVSCRCTGQVNSSVVLILGFCLLVGTGPDISSGVHFWACAKCGSLCISGLLTAQREIQKGYFFPTFCSWLQNSLAYKLVCEQKHNPSWQQVVEFIPIELDRSWKENISVSTLCHPGHSAVLFYKFKGTERGEKGLQTLALLLCLFPLKQRALRMGSTVPRFEACLAHVNVLVNLIAIEPVTSPPLSLDPNSLEYKWGLSSHVHSKAQGLEGCDIINQLWSMRTSFVTI